MRYVSGIIYMAAFAMLFVGCTKVVEQAPSERPFFDVNLYSLNKLVCDPFDGGPSHPSNPDFGRGLKANLFYLRDDQPRYQYVKDYINSGVKADQFLFFTSLNVPTRMFDTGFPTESGSLIKRDDGSILHEYFGLRLSTVLHLGPDDEEGVYELAILSDDGAIWKLRGDDGNYVEVVNNDGDHPTQMGCSDVELTMTRDSERLMQFDYYQGPRYHISVIPMWRKKLPGQQPEQECGKSGNNYFFKESDSTPKQPYLDLLARGWKPLTKDNYSLPASTIFNPCQPGEPPQIFEFAVEDMVDGLVIARWITDMPATSQLKIVDMVTGEETLTQADNGLRYYHEVEARALKSGRQYSFQGVSISDSYGIALSDPVILVLH